MRTTKKTIAGPRHNHFTRRREYRYIYIYNPPPLIVEEKKFPTPTGKTEQIARKTCNKTIRNLLMRKSCLDTIKNWNIQSFIDQCVVDVRVSIEANLEPWRIFIMEFSYVNS